MVLCLEVVFSVSQGTEHRSNRAVNPVSSRATEHQTLLKASGLECQFPAIASTVLQAGSPSHTDVLPE